MRYEIRPARFEDFAGMRRAWRRDELGALGRAIVRSQTFALLWVGGVVAAGGICPIDGERQCWMHVAPAPPARALLAGVREILSGAGPGDPLACYVNSLEKRHVRYAEALGFRLSSAPAPAPNLPLYVVRMERPA